MCVQHNHVIEIPRKWAQGVQQWLGKRGSKGSSDLNGRPPTFSGLSGVYVTDMWLKVRGKRSKGFNISPEERGSKGSGKINGRPPTFRVLPCVYITNMWFGFEENGSKVFNISPEV